MRDIEFRGKRTDNGEWVEGHYYKAKYYRTNGELCDYITIPNLDEYIIPTPKYVVDASTIGQYTGLKDKNGTKIFEGDIVKNDWCFIKGNSIVRFDEYKSSDSSNDYQCGHLGFYLEHISDFNKRTVRKDIMYFANKCEIIGNIFDNPELLKEG